jgi:hypothetical protein
MPDPTLHEILQDPIVRLLMRRDGVSPGHVETLVKEFHARRRGSQASRPSEPAARQDADRIEA